MTAAKTHEQEHKSVAANDKPEIARSASRESGIITSAFRVVPQAMWLTTCRY